MEQPIQFNFWALLIILGAVQGFFLTMVLWNKGNNVQANRIFALLLFSIALHLIEYALCISGIIFRIPHALFVTYPIFFIIGPLFYFYVRSYLQFDLPKKNVILLHAIPALLLALMLTPFYLLSASEKIHFFLGAAKDGFKEIPPSQFIIMYGQIIHILLYLYFCNKLIKLAEKRLPLKRKSGKLVKITWLKNANKAFALFIALFASVTMILIVQNNLRIEFDYVVVLTMAGLIYVIGYKVIQQPEVLFEKYSQSKPALSTDVKIMQRHVKKLNDYMVSARPYLNDNLKLETLAKGIEIPPHVLSSLINSEFGCGFFDYINNHRVEEAKRLLLTDNQNKKILAIAFESGFGTKATFNRVFKEFTDQTPSSYRKSHLKSD